MLYGVDVHDGYQAGLSFPLLVQQGYSFAAVKFTQGTTYVRDLADEWILAAKAAGLIPGAYHWLTAADGAAQARWFCQNLAKVGGPEGLLIQLDCEDDGYGPQMSAWAAEWNRLTGGHPFFIYSGAWWWPRTGGFGGAALTPWLWHSHYLEADADIIPDDPAAFAARIPAWWWTPGYGGWPAATIIQFTSRGDAGSLGNNVDLNVTNLTREQLLALTTAGDDMTPIQGNFLHDVGYRLKALVDCAETYTIPAYPATLAPAKTETNLLAKRVNAQGALLASYGPRLDEILAAASNDAQITLPPEYLAALADLKTAIAELPTADETMRIVDAQLDQAAHPDDDFPPVG